jgi:hypothetical protein
MIARSAHPADAASIVHDAILCPPLGDNRMYSSKMEHLVVHSVRM